MKGLKAVASASRLPAEKTPCGPIDMQGSEKWDTIALKSRVLKAL